LLRIRRRQSLVLRLAGVVFLVYYVVFHLLGIYPGPALVTGVLMAAGLGGLGQWLQTAAPRAVTTTPWLAAVVLSSGAIVSAALSEGTRCIGFDTIWAIPLIYGLFFHEERRGSLIAFVISCGGGLALLVHDGETVGRLGQWAALSVAAVAFSLVVGELSRREFACSVAEAEEAHTRLAVADRMASLGLLATGVSHEINNPLAFIRGNLDYVAEELESLHGNDALHISEAISDARIGCEQVQKIAGTLSRLSRSRGTPEPLDLNRALADVLHLARRRLEEQARTIALVPGDIGLVSGDGARLGQVFLNLLVNAAYAVERRPDGPGTITVRTFVRAPDSVVVEVSDTGCGIPAEHLRSLFQPFFTSKPEGSGTGLGLALSAQIVNEHGGVIEVESSPGVGSAFRVVLPRSRP
jgi:signal transduction histidine kinase